MATRSRRRAPMLREPVTTQDTPGSPNGHIAPTAGQQATISARLTESYVSAGGFAYWANFARSLPHPFDDLTKDLSTEVYESMQHDGVVRAALTVLAAAALEDSVNLTPSIEDDGDPDAALSQQITDFCAWTLDNLKTPLDATLWDMLTSALAFGSCVAEQLYELQTVDGTQRMVLADLKVKPLKSTAFVVNAYNDILGLVAVIPGVAYTLLQSTVIGDLKNVPNLLPREKFAILSFRPRNNDPRGTSILRSAYQAWWHKMQMWGDYLRFLTQFASPIPVGTTGPAAMPSVDPITGIALSPEQALLGVLQGIKAGAAIAVPFGTTVQLHFSQGAGDAYINAMDQDDRQMTVAILGQTLATGEGRHNARAAAQVHADVLAQIERQIKLFVTRMIKKDILRPLIEYNFGADAAARLVPDVSLGETETADQSKLVTALATVDGFKLLPSQLQDTYTLAGLPEAEPDEITALAEAQAAGQKAAIQMALNPPDASTSDGKLPRAGNPRSPDIQSGGNGSTRQKQPSGGSP